MCREPARTAQARLARARRSSHASAGHDGAERARLRAGSGSGAGPGPHPHRRCTSTAVQFSTMGKERKCILCNIIYSSKGEMDEHMRSMLHHRELENLKGRKNDVPKQGNRATDGEGRRYRKMREDLQACEHMSQYQQAAWHHGSAGERDWALREFAGSRSNAYHWKTNSGGGPNRHSTGLWASQSWQPEDKGGAPNWNLNRSWHPSGPGGVASRHHKNKGGLSNWGTNSGSGGDNMPHYKNSRSNGKLQPGNTMDSMEEADQQWSKGKMQKLNKMEGLRYRHPWDKMQVWRRPVTGRGAMGRIPSDRWNAGDYALQEYGMDFTSDDVPGEGMLIFNNGQSKGDQTGGKSVSPPRDKRRRFTPYRSQKSTGALDPGLRSKSGNDSESSCKSAQAKDVEAQQKGSGFISGKVAEERNNSTRPLTQPSCSAKDESKDEEQSPFPASPHTKLFPHPPHECVSSASDSFSKKDDPSFGRESGKCLRSSNLKTHRFSPPESMQQLNNAPNASKARLSTEATADPTLQPSLAVPGGVNKSQLDNSLGEMLRLAREALRQSQSECGQESQPESGEESGEGNKENWKNTNKIQKANEKLAPGDSRKISQELTDIAEELDPAMVVDSAGTHSGQRQPSSKATKKELDPDTVVDCANSDSNQKQPCAKTVKEQAAVLDAQHDEAGDVGKTKCDLKAYLTSGAGDQLPSTFPFALSETKNPNVVPSMAEAFDHCSSDPELQNEGAQGCNHLLSELNKLGLPTSVQRDLTRHINSKSRPGTHTPEPNLNIARRIRSIGDQRKSESEKESGLKPTVRQLLNVSRHHVNWDQVIQQVAKKKQELGKGLPRFGIEMVPSVQTSSDAPELDEDENLSSLEGFQWEGISNAPTGTIRKRSLSESSVVTDKRSIYNLFGNDVKTEEGDRAKERAPTIPSSKLLPLSLGPNGSSCPVKGVARDSTALAERFQVGGSGDNTSTQALLVVKQEGSSGSPLGFDSTPVESSRRGKASLLSASEGSRPQGYHEAEGASETHAQQSSCRTVQDPAAADGATDSSYTSGGELNDTQVLGKKRRATPDGLSPELPGLERKNKRRKIKSKRERNQLDQLLSISLREDELNKTSQGLDGNLLQARATLQAAYIEVQKFLLLKQQITLEMSTLRTKRIEILQGLQESNDPSGERSMQSPATEISSLHRGACDLNFHIPFSPLLCPVPCSGSSSDLRPRPEAVPGFQAAAATSLPVVSNASIKQEPTSPKRTEKGVKSSEPLPYTGRMLTDCHKSALSHCKGQVTPTGYPLISLPPCLQPVAKGFVPAGHAGQGVLPGLTGDKAARMGAPAPGQGRGAESGPPHRPELFAVPEKRGSLPADKRQKGQREVKSQGSELQQEVESSITPSESRSSKKKKKLRKKKTPRVTRSGENSDTEQDTELVRPQRKLRTKKVARAKVTTSTHQGSDGALVPRVKGCQRGESEMRSATTDSDSTVQLLQVSKVEHDQVAVELLEPAGEQPDSPPKGQRAVAARGNVTDLLKATYDEVTSTSEIGTSCAKPAARGVAETQTPVSSQRGSRNTSEVSSDEGEEEDPTEGTFTGHQAAVNAMQIYGGQLYTCSADKTVRVYNLTSRQCVGTFEANSTKVNCLLIIQMQGKNACLYTGSSDHIIRRYDVKSKVRLDQFTLSDRVLCLHCRWRILYAGLANGMVATFNVKSNKQLEVFDCHGPRAVSCLATAQEGARRLLLVGSYDCTISVRDARNGLLLRTLEGHTKTVLCMKVINDLVFSGSSDQSVHAHNIHTGELVRIYKGHSHAVTVVNILGKVMVTACLDKLVRVYELQSHDRLQVYGGHKDMVMCMVIHNSMIYTGCYDGSIQAVRLNLMQNYRCWWTGCTLIFGVMNHLKHHLLMEHNSTSAQTQKCRWRNCDAFFTVRNRSKQEFPKHLCQHAEENSHLDP
ncbi:zinc finger protein 106 isoform X3 [Amblyraja radiata]|uniref:zinc finger protein 106 isoform X3 n=1 Tax=Amblyraja radiata TaxID=386614 RepID=UPI001402A835|nr:zinc finger protein 106 isoform X3 [Amblyraja radiata]